MRTILRSDVLTCLDNLRSGGQYDLAQLEADIFRLFDDRELRKLPCSIERFVEEEASADILGQGPLQPRVYERWAILEPYIYVDGDDRDPEAPDVSRYPVGYFNSEGDFVPKPSLWPLPRYCRSTDDASNLRIGVFGYHLLLDLNERQTETMDYEFEARLRSDTGETISDYVSTDAPIAIVGATLTALEKGWMHPLIGYSVRDA